MLTATCQCWFSLLPPSASPLIDTPPLPSRYPPDVLAAQYDNSTVEHMLRYSRDAGRLGTGVMLTEMAEACGSDHKSWNTLTSAAEGYSVSWISWELKTFSKGPPFPTPDSQWNE